MNKNVVLSKSGLEYGLLVFGYKTKAVRNMTTQELLLIFLATLSKINYDLFEEIVERYGITEDDVKDI